MRWAACIIPPLIVILWAMTPTLWMMDGITNAALSVVWPVILLLGTAIVAALVGLARWLSHAIRASRKAFISMLLGLVGITTLPLIYGGTNWPFLLFVVLLGAVPAALLLGPKQAMERVRSAT
jgi:uncharacterized membrane protein